MSSRVFGPELLQGQAGHTELLRLFPRTILAPMIHHHPLDEPHSRGAIASRAVNVCGLNSWRRDDFEKLGDGRFARVLATEGNIEVVQPNRFRRRAFGLYVGAGLARQPEIDV